MSEKSKLAHRPYADLHAHPSGKNFPRHYTIRPEDFQQPDAHLWNIPPFNIGKLIDGMRATGYNQSDIGSLVEYSGKLIFASIYPFERGFVQNMGRKLKPPRLLMQLALRYTRNRIRLLLGESMDYFEELKAEWEFLQRKSGRREDGFIPDLDSPAVEEPSSRKKIARGVYYLLAHDPDRWAAHVEPWGPRKLIGMGDLDKAIARPNLTVLVLTVEGMHALSMKTMDRPVEAQVLLDRIAEIKRWPVFFMTFAHHFDNQLCAHAHSLFKAPLPWNPDQQRNMNFITEIRSPEGAVLSRHNDPRMGFTPLGLSAIHRLLSLREQPGGAPVDDPSLGRRILVDTKHMSAASRLEFYQKIVRPYNAAAGRRLARDGKPAQGCLPVLASHSAFSGVATLEEMIAGFAVENDDLREGNRFNYWNINLSAEDVGVIVQSGGLIGLNLDQRVLGIMYRMRLRDMLMPRGFGDTIEKRNKAELIVDNLLGMAQAVKDLNLGLHHYSPDRFSVWNSICLGTDFDGGIDPVAKYSTAESMEKLREDMKNTLLTYFRAGMLKDFIDQEGQVEEILQLFFWDNAYRFLKMHFEQTEPLLA